MGTFESIADAKRKTDEFLEINSVSPDTTLEGYRPREYLVLGDTGKPVLRLLAHSVRSNDDSHPDGQDIENSPTIMGTI
ncbi:hypothetical protein BDR03DRAFT_956377 [Suillus americanus]|nr:hypothetical protein BDR03DRAFT_956377 [Suillus americanus]